MNSEFANRLAFIYGAQISLALIIGLLFFFFYKSYNRELLKWWSFSWLAYAAIHICSMSYLYIDYKPPWSFLGIFFSYLQLLMLIVGVVRFMAKDNYRRLLPIGSLLITIVSLLSYFLFYDDPNGSNERYILRVGLKSVIIGTGFLWVAIKILFAKVFKRRFSKYFLISAIILYALQQFWFASIVFLNVSGVVTSFPINSYGIIDLFSIAVMGIGMIVWLLENERILLRQANKELDTFLYSTSHDLRAPLASILGLTNLGKLESKDEVSLGYFQKIENRVNKLDSIVGDILNYSKSLKMSVTKSKIDFKGLIQAIFEQHKFATNQHALILKIDNDGSPHLYSDENQLTIVLNNLLSNAVKYSDPAKEVNWIDVSLKRDGALIRIMVKDNGIGIEENSLANIFSMFYRATNQGEGSGLGLYIASEAIKKLKGELLVESKLGTGSTFTIVLNENWI